MSDDVTLLPCPFCGAQVELNHSHVAGEGAYITHVSKVGGNNCGIEVFNDFSIEGDLATVWNTRTPSPDRGERMREALEKCRQIALHGETGQVRQQIIAVIKESAR